MKHQPGTEWWPPFLAVVVVIAAFALSLWIRWPAFNSLEATPNLEATYHALWSAKAMAGSSVASHNLLSSVTLSPWPGNDIAWGAAVPTAQGSYIYTSFPPLGFWLAAPAASLGADSLDLLPLSIFNSFIGLIAAILLAGLARAVYLDRARETDQPATAVQRLGWLVFAAVAATTLLLCESLQSHGVVYWAQSPAQIIFVAGAWLAYASFKGDTRRITAVALVACCVIYPLLEWSGYVFNVGLGLAFGLRALSGEAVNWRRPLSQPSRTILLNAAKGWPIWIAAVTAIVGSATLIHLIMSVGAGEALGSLADRAVARSVTPNLLGLPVGYWTSLGLLLPLGLTAAILTFRERSSRRLTAFTLLLLVCAFPLLENLVMLEHATLFSFDRLKLIVPLTLVAVWWAAQARAKRLLVWVPLTAALVIASNVVLYHGRQAQAHDWVAANQANKTMAAEARSTFDEACILVGSPQSVRGYLNLLAGRDIYERVDLQALTEKAAARGACGVVLVEMENVLTDLPRIKAVTPVALSRSDDRQSP